MPVSTKPFSNSKIPIVSLSQLTKNREEVGSDAWTSTAASLDMALSQMGFAYIIDHGIPEVTIRSVFEESRAFFALPLDIKMKYERDFATTFHGYTQVGGVVPAKEVSIELREHFDAALAESSEFLEVAYPDNEAPHFQPALKALMREGRRVSLLLLKCLGLGLGLENSDFFLKIHRNLDNPSKASYTQMRSLMYPGVLPGQEMDATRCAPHTDYGTLTLLFQDDVAGLEVVNAEDGQWIKATPIPSSILINVGDFLEIWSRKHYPSTVHRVIIPEDPAERSRQRQSVAIFIKPDNDVLVKPLIRDPADKDEDAVDPVAHFRRRTIENRD